MSAAGRLSLLEPPACGGPVRGWMFNRTQGSKDKKWERNEKSWLIHARMDGQRHARTGRKMGGDSLRGTGQEQASSRPSVLGLTPLAAGTLPLRGSKRWNRNGVGWGWVGTPARPPSGNHPHPQNYPGTPQTLVSLDNQAGPPRVWPSQTHHPPELSAADPGDRKSPEQTPLELPRSWDQ